MSPRDSGHADAPRSGRQSSEFGKLEAMPTVREIQVQGEARELLTGWDVVFTFDEVQKAKWIDHREILETSMHPSSHIRAPQSRSLLLGSQTSPVKQRALGGIVAAGDLIQSQPLDEFEIEIILHRASLFVDTLGDCDSAKDHCFN